MIKIVENGYQLVHAPGSVLDHGFDWSRWLGARDIVVASSWVCDDGITITNESYTSTITSATISGGVDGYTYNATNTIVTALGNTDSRTFILVCHQR